MPTTKRRRRAPKHRLIKNRQDMMNALIAGDCYTFIQPEPVFLPSMAENFSQFGMEPDDAEVDAKKKNQQLAARLKNATSAIEKIGQDIEKNKENTNQTTLGKASNIPASMKKP